MVLDRKYRLIPAAMRGDIIMNAARLMIFIIRCFIADVG